MKKKQAQKLKQALAWKGVKSFEFRVLWWALRGAAALSFVIYLASSAMGAKSWVELKWTRMQDFSRLDVLLKAADATGDLEGAAKWAQFRPLSETPAIIDALAPYSGRLPTSVFLDFLRRADAAGDAKQADKWSMIAHYRMHFDILRCGLTDGADQEAKLAKLLSIINPGYERRIAADERRQLARDILAFDAQYPAANDPQEICKALGRISGKSYTPVPRDQWESYRHGLREATKIGLENEESGLKAKTEKQK